MITLFCLSSCNSPLVQKFIPISKDAILLDNKLITGNNEELPVRIWQNNNPQKAIIIALHGFNEYSNSFAGAGEYLQKKNITLIAYDQRGFGQTKDKGIWAGRDNLTQDLLQMIKAANNRYHNIPIFILGESMGGAVVISALAENKIDNIEGIILSAPAVWGDKTMNNFYRITLWLMAHTLPDKQVTGKNIHIFPSDNITMLKALWRDPLIIKKTRIDSIYGIVSLMDFAYSNIHKIKVPMLFLYGANDQIIPKLSIYSAINKIESPHKIAYYPDGYHMLLRDIKGDIVLKDIVSWINNKNLPLSSGYDNNWQERMNKHTKNPMVQKFQRFQKNKQNPYQRKRYGRI